MSWDDYAPFYDWENARTMGRRDLAFWQRFVAGRGRSLELGCGTGRLLVPLARGEARILGVDYSARMLDRARRRVRRLPRARRPGLVRGDMRCLPFRDRSFDRVFAPYGVLQSLMSDADLDTALLESSRLLKRGGSFGFELIPELTNWSTYQREVRFQGRLGRARITLTESVRQDRRRGLTIFDEEFTVREGRRTTRHRFPLTFRTVPMEAMLAKLSASGLTPETLYGSYKGEVWTPDSAVWLAIARR